MILVLRSLAWANSHSLLAIGMHFLDDDRTKVMSNSFI